MKILLLFCFILIFNSSCREKRRCTVSVLCGEDSSEEECYKFYKEEIRKCERGD